MNNEEFNKRKKEVNLWAVITGITSGICIYGIVNKGFEFYFMFPIILTSFYAYKHWKKLQEIKNGKN